MDHLTICKQRKKTYELLSYCLLNVPTKESLQSMKEVQEILKELIEDGAQSEYSIEFSELEMYEQEYYDRFFVPTSSRFVPPYESSMRNSVKKGEKVKFGKLETKEAFHVKACYEMVSFNPQKLNAFNPLKEIQFPDHIAFEMSFITFLVAEEEKSLEQNQKEKALRWKNLQIQFLDEHLSKWIEDYAKLSEEKNKGLYSHWLNLCAAWIKEDILGLELKKE